MFNDFLIKETPAAAVQELFGDQMTPCLLYYTQVRPLSGGDARSPPLLVTNGVCRSKAPF